MAWVIRRSARPYLPAHPGCGQESRKSSLDQFRLTNEELATIASADTLMISCCDPGKWISVVVRETSAGKTGASFLHGVIGRPTSHYNSDIS
jgi:hypothetical protein